MVILLDGYYSIQGTGIKPGQVQLASTKLTAKSALASQRPFVLRECLISGLPNISTDIRRNPISEVIDVATLLKMRISSHAFHALCAPLLYH